MVFPFLPARTCIYWLVAYLFEEFWLAFMARFESSVQEKYAYKNTEVLLQKRQ
jgi:hypothetical protein